MALSRKEIAMPTSNARGVIDLPSNYSVDETVQRLMSILAGKHISLFASVDHSGEAEKVGMKMPPTKLIIFGSPEAGTPIMLAAPSIAIDLPLRFWSGKTRVRECGFPTTARNTCRTDTASRMTSCKASE
jgi:uncharacterized protein (DUF302 family)